MSVHCAGDDQKFCAPALSLRGLAIRIMSRNRLRIDVASCVVLVIFAALVGHAAVGMERRLSPPIGLQVITTDRPPQGGLQFVLLAQAADCESGLAFVTWLRDRTTKTSFDLTRIVHLGPTAELGVLQRWASSYGVETPVIQADDRLHRSLAGLAQGSTPWLLGVDATGAIRLSLSAPNSPRERRAVLQMILAASTIFASS